MNRAAILAPLLVFAEAGNAQEIVWDREGVRAHCEGEWPDDFSMQAYCIEQNQQGFDGFKKLAAMNAGTVLEPAFAGCIEEWGIQWDMVEYCASQQRDGLEEAPTAVAGLPEEVADTILAQCSRQWGSDFSMVAYCADQQAGSWRAMNE